VTFVSFQDNGKGDRMIAFIFRGDLYGIRTVYFPEIIRETFTLSMPFALYGGMVRSPPRIVKQLLEIMGFHMRRGGEL
jgi:hypothetical protein